MNSRAGSNVWCYCDQCHIARKERSPVCAVKKLPFLALKSLSTFKDFLCF